MDDVEDKNEAEADEYDVNNDIENVDSADNYGKK